MSLYFVENSLKIATNDCLRHIPSIITLTPAGTFVQNFCMAHLLHAVTQTCQHSIHTTLKMWICTFSYHVMNLTPMRTCSYNVTLWVQLTLHHWCIQKARGPSPQTSDDIFCSVDQIFIQTGQLLRLCKCKRSLTLHDPLTRGSTPGSCWGLFPRPCYRFVFSAHYVAHQTDPGSASVFHCSKVCTKQLQRISIGAVNNLLQLTSI